ncbi:hypothetical protein [Bradyrhizobium liaoningense]
MLVDPGSRTVVQEID